jgi:hypothetical protein
MGKKILLVLCLSFLGMSYRSVNATTLNISFTVAGVVFETNYSKSNYDLIGDFSNRRISYVVNNKSSGETVEKWVFNPEEISTTRNWSRSYTGIIGNYRYLNYKEFGIIFGLSNTIINEVLLEKYSYGSTAQINKVVYSTHMIQGWSYMSFESFNEAFTPSFPVWGVYPCTKMRIDYTAVILASLDGSMNASVGSELKKVNFSFGGQVGMMFYYRAMVYNTYIIRVM